MLRELPKPSFTADGEYDLRSKDKRYAAVVACLQVITGLPQAYGSKGPAVVAMEMERTAVNLLERLKRR